MQLLAPLWLLAASAVVIPIVYHLRRNTPPEVVKVGSVANLTTGAALANRRTPRDWPLLITRCMLILIVAFALAQPLVGTSRAGRRVIVAPRGDWAVIDSLRATGAVASSVARSRYPWSVAVAASGVASARDTLLIVAPGGEDRWIGPRPVLTQVSTAIAVFKEDSLQPAPPLHQLATSVRDGSGAPPRVALSGLLWWMAILLGPLERTLARRSPDAG